MQQMYNMIMAHKRAMAEIQILWEKEAAKHQHEYDSDEELDPQMGTWEHRLRHLEMEKTRGGRNNLQQSRVWGFSFLATTSQQCT